MNFHQSERCRIGKAFFFSSRPKGGGGRQPTTSQQVCLKNMQTSEEIAQQGCKDENVSEVVVGRRQRKPLGANVGGNAEPVRSLEVAESKVVAGDSGIEKKL